MYKCINCKWEGEELSQKPLPNKCPVCGDEVNQTKLNSLIQEEPKKKNDSFSYDLNGDGKFDEKDKSIAGKVLSKRKGRKKK